MPTEKQIITVISLVKKAVQQFHDPIVTELGEQTRDPFKVLIGCLLSLRTRDETTAKASKRLFALADTPQRMAKLPTKKIEKTIYPVGFYKTKAKRIKEICKVLIEKYNSKVPNNPDELLKLKGVGRKTRNIVMNYGFNNPNFIAVDTHVNRIPNRLGWIKTKTPGQTEQELMRILPRKHWRDFNDTFVTFGQNICKPVGPKCNICPVTRYCKYYREVYKPLHQSKV